MNIGIIDADLMWVKKSQRRWGNTKADLFPNLACMKLSAWHKKRGDTVEWWTAFSHYDIVYISKVFSVTPDLRCEVVNSDKVLYGGSGWCIRLENGKEVYIQPDDPNYMSMLSEEVEHIYPDYSIYPGISDTAYGFLSRGCPRGCHFCHVAAKEGQRSYKVADLSEWWNGQKNIILMDPNLLACREWRDLFQQLIDSKARIDMNQGIDARLMTVEKAKMLGEMKLSTIHFAWDDYKQKDAVLRGLRIFSENYGKKFAKGHMAQVFVLVNFDTTFEQDLERIYTLRDMCFDPYVMVYDKAHCAPRYKSLQRWVNMRAVFHKISTFEEYDAKLAKE